MTSRGEAQDIEAEVDAFVAEVMQCANIPGLSLTIVRDGEVRNRSSTCKKTLIALWRHSLIFQEYITKGYGIQNVNTNDAVDETTLFHIASVTKAMSGASLATVLANQDRDE